MSTCKSPFHCVPPPIIGMGRALKLPIVVEGVETRDQLTFLQMQGCIPDQGYLFSKPAPLESAAPYAARSPIGRCLDGN